MRNARSLLAPLLLLAASPALAAEPAAPAPAARAEVGKPAPDFALKDETGKEHRLAQYQGKTVVLEWQNPDCPFVKRHYSADTMQKVYAAAGGKDVVWLSVDSTSTETPARSVSFKQEEKLSWPVLQDRDGKVGRAYAAKTTPHMYVIDAKGVLRYAGAIDDDPRGNKSPATNYVRGALEAVKSGKNPDPSSTTPYGCSVKYAGS